MRNAYVTMIGGTLLLAALLAGAATMIAPREPVSPVSAKDAATASTGTASQQAAALEAAEQEARENPPPPSPSVAMEDSSGAGQSGSAVSTGYQGTAPTPTIQFADSVSPTGEEPPPETPAGEE